MFIIGVIDGITGIKRITQANVRIIIPGTGVVWFGVGVGVVVGIGVAPATRFQYLLPNVKCIYI